MDIKSLIPAIEAVLFSGGEPISIERLSQVFSITPEQVEECLEALTQKLSSFDSGIAVLKLDNCYQLATKKEYAQYIKSAFDMRKRTPLSQAALEVLAVIAYNEPVTKSFIEQVRGVDCSGVVTTLVEKELIEECGRLELPGRPLLYRTTKVFLRSFSISSLADLPPLPRQENAVMPELGEQLAIDEE